eukprot:scaffold6564_cov179-Skeletonema_marinoi.AAC.2
MQGDKSPIACPLLVGAIVFPRDSFSHEGVGKREKKRQVRPPSKNKPPLPLKKRTNRSTMGCCWAA